MHPAPRQWRPPIGNDVTLVTAGRYWGAVKVGRPAVADAALTCLRARTGAVFADPFGGSTYWLVDTGSTALWPAVPTVTVLGAEPHRTHYIAVPPVSHDDGPRPHWKVPPNPTTPCLTNPNALLAALRTATRTVLGQP
ncbi:hypothetical protein GCM10027168_06960 [Streptomyces capparidis]